MSKASETSVSAAKSLEEFIFDEVCRISTHELASHHSPTVFEAGTIASKAIIKEALRVCEEWKKRNDTEDGVIDFLKSWAGEK